MAKSYDQKEAEYMAAKTAQKVARQYTMRLPCINEDEFLRVQQGFP